MEQQINAATIESAAARLAAEYVDRLIESWTDRPGGPGWEIPAAGESHGLQWNNPENIASGTSGIILLLIEHYRLDGRGRYLKHIEQAVAHLLDWCKGNPTGNYSLYTGRAGVVYVLLQLYQVTGNRDLVEAGIGIMEPANREYLHSRHVTDHLFDGRAGTLLLLLKLYAVSAEESLAGYIGQFAAAITYNARLTREGLFWGNEEEPALRRSCGFAHGSSGICLVLKELSRFCCDPVIGLIVGEAERYKQTCWVEEFQNWGNFQKDILNKETLYSYKELFVKGDAAFLRPRNDHSWAHAGPAAYPFLLNGAGSGECDRFAGPLGPVGQMPESFTLYSGWSGLEELFERCCCDAPEIRWAGGLFHGQPGSVYLLLRAMEKGGSECILFPFGAGEGKGLPSITLSTGMEKIRMQFISRYYGRTVNLLVHFPEPYWQQYLEEPFGPGAANDIVRFTEFVEALIHKNKRASPLDECLEDVFELERCKLEFFEADRRSSLEIYLDQLLYSDMILERLNRPGEWLLEQPVSISQDIKIVYSKWDWSLYDDFEGGDRLPGLQRQLKNPEREPGRFEYILQRYARFENNETHLRHPFTLFLHIFDRPKPIREAVVEIGRNLESLGEEEIGRMLMTTGLPVVSRAELMPLYGNLIIGKMRNWLHRGILNISFKSNDYEKAGFSQACSTG